MQAYRSFVDSLMQLHGLRQHASRVCEEIENGGTTEDIAFDTFCLMKEGDHSPCTGRARYITDALYAKHANRHLSPDRRAGVRSALLIEADTDTWKGF